MNLQDDDFIKLQSLEKEYAVLISQYEEAHKNYMDILKSGTEKELTEITGRSWWGTGGLKEGDVETKDDCVNMCLSDDKCSGATFNPEKRYCWTRTGNNTLSIEDTNIALVPKLKASIITLTYLNKQLMDINQKISDEFNKIRPKIEEQNNDKSKTQTELDAYYVQLSNDKKEMKKLLDEYYSIEQNYLDNNLVVKQQNGLFKLWMIIACVVILILYKIYAGDSMPTSAMFFILIIILIIFSLNISLWSIVILGLLIVLGKQFF